jgi:hypothetical protein
MQLLMRILTAAAILALAACASSQGQASPRPIASATDPNALGVAKTSTVEAARVSQSSREIAPPPVAPGASKTVQIDTSRKLEAVDLYVDMRDQNSMRQLVPYLLQNEEWMLVKSEYTSATTRHYRFQRISTGAEPTPLSDPRRAVKPR